MQASNRIFNSEAMSGPPHDDLYQDQSSNDKILKPDNNISLPPISPLKPYGRKVNSQRDQNGRGYDNKKRFRLDWEFKHKLRQLPEPWKAIAPSATNPGRPDDVVAQIVFERTYQRGGESWAGIVIRVIEGTFNMQLRHFRKNGLPFSFRRAQKSAQEMANRMHAMKFLPPGRGLWAMGAPIIEQRNMYAALQNCFSGSEKFITQEYGPVTFEEIYKNVLNQQITVLTPKGWMPALIQYFGVQPVQKVTFVSSSETPENPNFNNVDRELSIVVTPNHKWILTDGTETTNLSLNDSIKGLLAKPDEDSDDYWDGIIHGLVFGLKFGDNHKNAFEYIQNLYMTNLDLSQRFPRIHDRLKTTMWTSLMEEFPYSCTTKDQVNYNAGFLKAWIDTNATTFVRGYIDRYGNTHNNIVVSLTTDIPNSEQWLNDYAASSGYILTESKKLSGFMKFTLRGDYNVEWKVKSIEQLPNSEPVYCATVPKVGSFVLASGIHTGNCSFVSTKNIDRNPTEPFIFCMDASMLGVGVGFDTEGAGRLKVCKPTGSEQVPGQFDMYVVEDSRSGWVDSVKLLLESYFRPKRTLIQFDYSEIRPKGQILKGMGGLSSGPEPLMLLHETLRNILNTYVDKMVDSKLIVDIMNLIGRCVVSGNIRRSAEIAFGKPDDLMFMDLKNYEINPERSAYGWTSNNSILATVGTNYNEIAKRIIENGEPGIGWIDNMRSYGRMVDPVTNKDCKISGANPCMEMGLEDQELCNLVETFPNRHQNMHDFMITLKYAFLYAKTVTLEGTHMPKTNSIMMRNRRIGTSVTGITQFLAKHSLDELRLWLDSGYKVIQDYDVQLSKIFCIPLSIKTTTVKPSGTVSLLAGATAGLHFPVSQNYIRRITISNDDPLYKRLQNAGYHIEPKILTLGDTPEETVLDKFSSIVSIPVSMGKNIVKTEENVSMWEQLALTAFMQRYWADNQVSCTIKFDPITEGPQIVAALDYYQYHLKGISFYPKKEMKQYPQLPYEPISYEKYLEMISQVRPLDETSSSKSGESMGSIPNESLGHVDSLSAYISEDDDDDNDGNNTDQSLLSFIPDSLNFCDGEQCQREL